MRGKIVFALVLACAAWQGPASAADKASQAFVKQAIQGNLAEIQVGKLAQEKGQSEGVRSFGKMLVTDHSKGNEQAESLAQSMGVTSPTQPGKKEQATYNKLSKLSGKAFDTQFVKAMISDHKQDISEFRKEAKKGGETGNFAEKTLPTLEKHLRTAESLSREASPTTGSAH